MAGEYDFYVPRPGTSGSTSNATQPAYTSAPKPLPPNQTPKWYFNGRVYTSYSSYQAAVQAYAEARRRQAALEAARRARAAAERQAAARREAATRAAQARLAQERAMRQRLETAATERERAAAAEAMRARAREEAQRAARRQAFENLQARYRALLQPPVRSPQDRALGRYTAANERTATTTGNAYRDQLLRRMRETVTLGDVERGRLLEKARLAENYEEIFKLIRKRQKETAGRYTDTTLYEQATKEHAKLLTDVKAERDKQVAKVYKAFGREDWKEVMRLVESEEYKAAMERFDRFHGEGQDSPAERIAAMQREISDTRNRFVGAASLGPRTRRRLREAELERRWESFEQEHLQRDLLPGRGPRLEGNYEEISVSDWLKEQDKVRRAAEAAQIDRIQRRERAIYTHGYYGEAVERRNGQMVFSESVSSQRQYEAMHDLFVGKGEWEGVISEREFLSLMRQVNNGLPVDRERATQRLMELGMQAYQRRDGDLWARAAASGGLPSGPISKRDAAAVGQDVLGGYASAQALSRKNLERFLTGTSHGGLLGNLNALSLNGVIGATVGNVVEGWETLVGGSSTFARMLVHAASGGGNLVLPDVEFDALFGSGNPFLRATGADGRDMGLLGIDTSDAAKQRNAQEFAELIRSAGSGFSDIGRVTGATQIYGQGWARGNTSILAEAAIDPLSFVGATRFLRAGRLAIADAGGLRAAIRRPATARDFVRLSMPERFGGLDPAEVQRLAERLRVAERSGEGWARVKGMSEEEFTELAEATLQAKTLDDAARASTGWQTLVRENPVMAQQIFTAVSEEASDLAATAGVRRITAQQLQSDIRYAQQAAERAEIEAREAAARTSRRQAEAAGATALEKVRAEQARAGVAPAVARDTSPLTPVQKRARTRLVREYERLAAERVRVAREAVDAAKAIDTARDGGFRQMYHQRLETAVARLRDLDDQMVPDPVTGALQRVEGEVSRARTLRDEFDRRHGSSSETPRFLGVAMDRVNLDTRYVQSQLGVARARLAAASAPGQIRHWTNRIKLLGEARDYLDVERRLVRGATSTRKRTMRKYGALAAKAINLNRVAARAVTRPAAREALLRDVRRRVYGAKVVSTPAPATAADRALFDEARDALNGVTVTPEIMASITALRSQFGDVDLLDLFYALHAANGTSRFLLGDVYDTYHAMRRVIRDRIGKHDLDLLMQAYRGDQLARGAVSLRQYRRLDDQVTQAIRAARGWAAKGQVRLGRPRGAPGVRQARDSELAEIWAKLATLKTAGVALDQYDDARSVLSDINVRHNRGVSLRRRAQTVSRKSGRSVDEVFDELREQAREDEVVNNIERLAMRNPDLAEDEIFALFELEMLDRDLAPFHKAPVNEYQRDVLAQAYADIGGGADVFDDSAADRLLGSGASEHPPFGNRAAMHEWMIEHGHFSPRAADAIRAGDRVFSVEAERDFWQAGFGHTPEWTKPEVLLPLLRNKDAHDAFYREVGVFNSDFEKIMSQAHLSAEQLRDEIVFGGPDVKRARSAEELRSWAIQRYGTLVSDDGVTLKEMPWLMTLEEYDDWLKRAVFDEPLMKASGVEFDPTMVKPKELKRFAEAMSVATRKSFDRAKAAGDLDGAWLPQEQVRFVMNVVDHLSADPTWRRFFDKTPPGKRLLDNVGAFWRAAMTWTIAFPLVNFLDSIGVKRGILAATYNGFRPLSRVSDAAREAFPTADSLGSRAATWYVKGRNGFANSLDPELAKWMRVRELGRGFTEFPVRASKFGEDRLRLDFGRSMFDRHYGALRRRGVADDLARRQAAVFARGKVDEFFPDLSNAGVFERVLNQLIPFFSYNLRLKLLSTKLAVQNPWLLIMGERLGDFIEEQNRLTWENEYPGVPFPSEDPAARRLWLRIGEEIYTVDLGSLSDYTRGMDLLSGMEHRKPLEWATEFFRIPHPSQAIFLANAFGFNGGRTPWGTPADWGDVSVWFDLAEWLLDGGSAAFDPNDPRSRDAIQIMSQMLLFKGFGRISPMKAKVQQFFAFMALDRDRAWAYYDENPDLQAYFALNGKSYRIEPGVKAVRISWFRTASDEERAEYDAAFDGLRELREMLDEQLDEFYLTPWSDEYWAWKKKRRALLNGYMADHPILGDVWGFWMEPREMAELREEWLVDDQIERYFALDDTRPQRDAFGEGTAGELDYQKALRAWYDMRATWLEAHPAVFDRLHHARNEVEQAWFEHEAMWAETLDRMADVKIKILELDLQLESDPGDEDLRALRDALYTLRGDDFAALDAESFGEFYTLVAADRGRGFITKLRDRLKTVVTFPGRGDLEYDTATPAQRREIDAEAAYQRGMDEVWATIGDDVTRFYDELRSRGLIDEYFARNPDKKAAYEAGQAYRGYMSRWVAALQRNDFEAAKRIWDTMPAWVHERYFAKHPDSKMRDGMGGGGTAVYYKGKWFKSAESRDRYIKYIENGTPSTAVYYNGKWFRSPESRDRYIRWIEGGQQGPEPPVDGEEPAFRSAESRQRFLDGQAYYAAMQGWVKLLKAKDYAAADAYFKALPEWMREKYFAKRPDQRAKHDLDSAALRLGAEYFLAENDAMKLQVLERNPQLRAWLDEHGGDEAAHRGLIFAIYRAIPSSEPWLKRTFRQRFPEIFSAQAAGERRIRKIARTLAEHPEMLPFYERALALQTRLYTEQLKLSHKPPKPWVMERKRRLRKRTRRRAARMSSHYATHYEARRGIRNSAGT